MNQEWALLAQVFYFLFFRYILKDRGATQKNVLEVS